MPESYTERGFANYVTLTDKYNSEVTVRKSSLATDDCVWIFASNPDQGYKEPSPHLNVEMAVKVRDALDEFIREHS
jgi:hypothetical protein